MVNVASYSNTERKLEYWSKNVASHWISGEKTWKLESQHCSHSNSVENCSNLIHQILFPWVNKYGEKKCGRIYSLRENLIQFLIQGQNGKTTGHIASMCFFSSFWIAIQRAFPQPDCLHFVNFLLAHFYPFWPFLRHFTMKIMSADRKGVRGSRPLRPDWLLGLPFLFYYLWLPSAYQ